MPSCFALIWTQRFFLLFVLQSHAPQWTMAKSLFLHSFIFLSSSWSLYLNSFRCSFSLMSFCNSTSFDILNQSSNNIFRFKSNILNLKESWSKNKGYYNVCIYQTFISCIQRVSMGITKRLQVQGYHRNVPFLLYVNFVMHSLYSPS